MPPRSKAAAGRTLRFGDIEVACSSVDRPVFPDEGITKGDVIDYYAAVADVMVPELRGRPLTIERFTKGLPGGGFYQKHWQKHYPAWIDHVALGGKTKVDYPIVDTPAALVYFANQGALAFHVWTSRKTAPTRPDLIVFDLDPPEGGFELVRTTARVLHLTLAAVGMTAFVKTTGSKGLHVVAALDADATFEAVGALGHEVATYLVTKLPELLTTEFYKKDRAGRLYFDTGRNAPGATFVAPYSLRGKPGAPVSAPITWDELDDPTLRADGFTLRDMRARLERIGDPWRTLRDRPASVAKARAALAALP